MKLFNFIVFSILLFSSTFSQADEIDFTDGAGDGLTTFQQTIQGTGASAGVVATFQNPIVDAGTNDFFNLSNGLALGTGGLGSSWEVVFDSSVTLYSYTINFSDGNIPFDITGAGVNLTGLSNASGTITPVSPINFQANEAYTFAIQPTANFGGLTFSQWNFEPAGLTVAAPVPSLSFVSMFVLVLLMTLLAIVGFRNSKAF